MENYLLCNTSHVYDIQHYIDHCPYKGKGCLNLGRLTVLLANGLITSNISIYNNKYFASKQLYFVVTARLLVVA